MIKDDDIRADRMCEEVWTKLQNTRCDLWHIADHANTINLKNEIKTNTTTKLKRHRIVA